MSTISVAAALVDVRVTDRSDASEGNAYPKIFLRQLVTTPYSFTLCVVHTARSLCLSMMTMDEEAKSVSYRQESTKLVPRVL